MTRASHIGRFRITAKSIASNPGILYQLMLQLTIVGGKYDPENHWFEFHGVSKTFFRPVIWGYEIPLYHLILDEIGNIEKVNMDTTSMGLGYYECEVSPPLICRKGCKGACICL